MNIAAIIVGIDGWEKYTLPLTESIHKHEPECMIEIVDNWSQEPYPWPKNYHRVSGRKVVRCTRQCYSAAINLGKMGISDADWYIVLSNDVLCTGPFAHILEQYTNGDLVGPCLKQVHGFDYLEGWCIAFPRATWDALGGWDEEFQGSDWEDVDICTTAREKGFGLQYDSRLPFVHLDQRQRFTVVEDFWGKNAHNQALFMRKHARVTA